MRIRRRRTVSSNNNKYDWVAVAGLDGSVCDVARRWLVFLMFLNTVLQLVDQSQIVTRFVVTNAKQPKEPLVSRISSEFQYTATTQQEPADVNLEAGSRNLNTAASHSSAATTASTASVPQLAKPQPASQAAKHEAEPEPVVAVPVNLTFYSSIQEYNDRKLRFPSVEERIKTYMSHWYKPPCPSTISTTSKNVVRFKYLGGDKRGQILMQEIPGKLPEEANTHPQRVFRFENKQNLGDVFYMNQTDIQLADNDYCDDSKKYLFPAYERQATAAAATRVGKEIPTMLQFGDAESMKVYMPWNDTYVNHPNIPVIKKFRKALSKEQIHQLTSSSSPQDECILQHPETLDAYIQPIVYKLTVKRHFGMLPEIPAADIPWEKKLDRALWRGGTTGLLRAGLPIARLSKLPHREMCNMITRCRLILKAADAAAKKNSKQSLVDAAFVGQRRFIPEKIDGVSMFAKESMDFEQMLRYKAIIMIEGNDISSGFKWALYSNSVVMTQPPTLTSWAMEERLEPWVHYVPLNDDLSDVEEKMQWVLDHDQEAKEIAHRGSLWIKDLMLHPDAPKDDEQIFDEIIRRYKAHFVEDTTLTVAG